MTNNERIQANNIEGIEVNIDNEYETKAIEIDERVINLETTVDTILGVDDIE